MEEKQAYTNEFYVAGVKFHQFHTVSDILEEGMSVDLVPELSNKYDKFAIKIKHNNIMLGYVPKKLSQEVTELMNSGIVLWVFISQLQPDFEPWTALKVEIREVIEDTDKCEFYPADGYVCDCNSDISGKFICTIEYSKSCQWANERRESDANTRKNA